MAHSLDSDQAYDFESLSRSKLFSNRPYHSRHHGNRQFGTNVGHFGLGHFGLGRFGPDISATDVSATENAKGGRFGQNHKYKVGVCACINV